MARNVSNERITEIYNRYSDMVYRLAFSRTANKQTAEDVFQEVFMKLVENANKLTNEDHLRYWLVRVTINCCNKTFRSKIDTVEYEDELSKGNDLEEIVKNSGEDILLKREREELIRTTLNQLKPPEYRDILYLFYYEEFKIEEIAKVMKITNGNAKTKLFRARAALRKALEGKV